MKEGKNLLIVQNNGKKRQGRLTIINDKKIELKNNLFGYIDTFNLSDIKKIKRHNVLSKSLGAVGLAFSGLYLGIATLFFVKSNSPFFVLYFTLNGVVGAIQYIAIFNGVSYKAKNYDYKIITTKGYKLKQKVIKTLLQ